MATDLVLSVLDQSPIPDGSTASDALANTIDLARLADRLGYHRYWLAEHHASTGLAGSAPEVLAARVAAETGRIRVGSGGVMLSHYASLKVAETFKVLHALHPGRIDLGLGRAPGGDQLTAVALQKDHELPRVDDFPRQVVELQAFLTGGFTPDHPFARITASPVAAGGPEVWLLGSSGYSASLAAQLGLPFSYAHFIEPTEGEEICRRYRQAFRPTDANPEPHLSIGVSVIVADDADEADRLASSLRLWRTRLMGRGEAGPIPSVEEALAHPVSGAERDLLRRQRGRLLSGTPGEVRVRIEELAEAYGADEVLAVTITHDHQARRRSYELLAAEMGLVASELAPAPGRP
jgi:luciferase family oxidoreductase group 1